MRAVLLAQVAIRWHARKTGEATSDVTTSFKQDMTLHDPRPPGGSFVAASGQDPMVADTAPTTFPRLSATGWYNRMRLNGHSPDQSAAVARCDGRAFALCGIPPEGSSTWIAIASHDSIGLAH